MRPGMQIIPERDKTSVLRDTERMCCATKIVTEHASWMAKRTRTMGGGGGGSVLRNTERMCCTTKKIVTPCNCTVAWDASSVIRLHCTETAVVCEVTTTG